MGREAIEKVIDKETYVFHPMNPKKSLRVLTKIFRLVGASVGSAVSADDKDVMDAGVGVIVGALCDRLNEDEVEGVVDTVLEQVRHKGKGEINKGSTFNDLFEGRIPHLFKVVYAALEVEYADFFAEGSALQGILRKAVATIPAR